MARGRGRGRGGARGKGKGGGRSRDDDKSKKNASWVESAAELTNLKFEAYYHDQQILSSPEEWAQFLETLRQPLPTTFRITAGLPTTSQIQKQMISSHVPTLSKVIFENASIPPPQQISWYPNHLAWSLDVKKTILRKNFEFKKFQRFLVSETEVGNISRQEAVSMLPPLFLDVKDYHLVLDMCASPGSKTAQIVEMLHGATGLGLGNSDEKGYDPNPKGFVVANDSDTKRAHMLVHQASRLPSPNLLVSNLDASFFPRMEVPWLEEENENDAGTERMIKKKSLMFDRILADVPCSGDGTLRKNIGIWKDWGMGSANGLHSLQVRILLRGLQLLRPGGRLVYSTCSMNPIENEAVISAALRECGAKAPADSEQDDTLTSDPSGFKGGNVRLVDCSSMLPDLKRRKGMTTWKVSPWKQRNPAPGTTDSNPSASMETGAGKEKEKETTTDSEKKAEDSNEEKIVGTDAYRKSVLPPIHYVSSHDELKTLDPELAELVNESMWPNGNEKNLGIEHCMRLYPHDQNTGAFFVAVLEKKEDSKLEGTDEKEKGMAYGMARAVLEGERRELNALAGEVEVDDKGLDEKSKGKRPASPTLEEESAPSSKKTKSDAPNSFSALESNADSGYGLSGGLPYKEDPFSYTPSSNSEIMICRDHFKLGDSFPSQNLLVRNSKNVPLRSIYLTSDSVHALIAYGGIGPIYQEKKNPNDKKSSSTAEDADKEGAVSRHPYMNPIKLRLLSAGTKLFARQSSTPAFDASLNCKWRATSDGLMALRPFIQDSQILRADFKDLKFLIKSHYSMVDDLPEGSFKESVKTILNGSFVVDVEPSECRIEKNEKGRKDRRDIGKDEESLEGKVIKLETKLTVPVWRAPTSINLMLDKQEKSALSLRLFGIDLSPPKAPMPRGKNASVVETSNEEGQGQGVVEGGNEAEGGEDAEGKEDGGDAEVDGMDQE